MVSVFRASLVDLTAYERAQAELREKVGAMFIQVRRLSYLHILRAIENAEYYTLATPDAHYTNIEYTPRKEVNGNYASETYRDNPYPSLTLPEYKKSYFYSVCIFIPILNEEVNRIGFIMMATHTPSEVK